MATNYDIDRELSSSGDFLASGLDHEEIHKRMEELDERLSCAVCLCRFSEPRLLDCNHSFCKHCLEDILAKRAMDLDHPIGEDELVCPRCRKITRLGGGGIKTLPRNFDLEAVATVMPPERDLPTPVKSKQGFVRQQSAPMCSQHSKELAYYCKTDENLLCGDCLIETNHKNHDTDHASKVGDEQREIFRTKSFEPLEKEFQNFSLAIKKVSYATTSLRQKGEQTKEQIQEHFQSLRENLVKTEQELLLGTDTIVNMKVVSLGEQNKQLNEMHEELDFEFQHAQKILESPPIIFLHAQKHLTAKIEFLVKKAKQVDRTPVEYVSQGPYWYHPSLLPDDSAHTSGVFCDPTPSMYTAVGVGLKKAFVKVEASFKVEARDKYGNRSFLKGTDPRVTIVGPGQSGHLPCTIDESVAGEYVIRYIPKEVGFHFITITVSEESIQDSEHRVTVFGVKDYLGLSKPLKSTHKSQLQTEPPVSTIRGVCALSNGSIIFTDAFCLRVIDGKTGALRQTIGSYGNAPSQFNTPLSIAVNFLNNIFVTDSSNHRVQRFSMEPNGRFRYVSLFGAQGNSKQCLQNPEGIAVLGDEKVFIADRGNNRIQVLLQKNMKQYTSFGKKGKRPGQFNVPRDVTINSYFNCLLVSDAENKRIQALTFDGRPLTTFGGHSSVCFETPPCFIAVDHDGFILITNTTYQVVTVLTPFGEYIRQFGNKGGTSRNFKTPYGICVDDQGMVIITDTTSNCIHFF